MITRLTDLFPIILSGAVIALAATPLLSRAAEAIGLVDIPGSAPHKQHIHATPLSGGPALASAVALTLLLFRPASDRLIQGILLGCLIMLAWGIADDWLSMSPLAKLLGQLAGVLVLVYFGIQVRIMQRPWLDLILTVLWVVGVANAFNLVDSMDGLALGLGAIALAFFMLVTLDSGQPQLAAVAAAILGAALGVFFFNSSPASSFLGDSGAQLLGFGLAAIGIAYVPAQAGLPQGVTWFMPILVLGVPIFDTVLVIASRLRRKLPIYRAQRDHTYHRLVALGLPPSRSVLAMQLAAVVLGLVAFVALKMSVLMANIIFGLVVLIGAGLIIYFEASMGRWRAPPGEGGGS